MEEMRQNEMRTKALLEISQMTNFSLEDTDMKALSSALQISGSSCGFIGLSTDDGRTVTVNHWSENLYPGGCDEPVSFNIEQKGIWGEALRQRKPIIESGDVDPLCLIIMQSEQEEHNHFICIPAFNGNALVTILPKSNSR
ncbi:MAG: GAF domain-containing protein [Candidatus Xenobiia bacterium LiM19]